MNNMKYNKLRDKYKHYIKASIFGFGPDKERDELLAKYGDTIMKGVLENDKKRETVFIEFMQKDIETNNDIMQLVNCIKSGYKLYYKEKPGIDPEYYKILKDYQKKIDKEIFEMKKEIFEMKEDLYELETQI